MASTDSGVTVETAELRFGYGDRDVLARVSLRASPGEVVGLVGPNGSGKSTLIKLLSGVLSGYAGSARVDGGEVRDLPRAELARRIAVVPQEPAFSFPFTALEASFEADRVRLAWPRGLPEAPAYALRFPDRASAGSPTR